MPKRKTQLTTLKPSKPVKKVIQEEIKSLLKRLVAIELKMEHFKAEYKGQMELYLRWLDRYERQPGEDSPIGLILCAGKSDEQVELLELSKSGIRVAEYMTEIPSRKILEKKLHQAIKLARARLSS